MSFRSMLGRGLIYFSMATLLLGAILLLTSVVCLINVVINGGAALQALMLPLVLLHGSNHTAVIVIIKSLLYLKDVSNWSCPVDRFGVPVRRDTRAISRQKARSDNWYSLVKLFLKAVNDRKVLLHLKRSLFNKRRMISISRRNLLNNRCNRMNVRRSMVGVRLRRLMNKKPLFKRRKILKNNRYSRLKNRRLFLNDMSISVRNRLTYLRGRRIMLETRRTLLVRRQSRWLSLGNLVLKMKSLKAMNQVSRCLNVATDPKLPAFPNYQPLAMNFGFFPSNRELLRMLSSDSNANWRDMQETIIELEDNLREIELYDKLLKRFWFYW